MNETERRRAQRIRFISTAFLRHGAEQILEARVDTRDISLNGVFVLTDQRLPLHTDCEVAIHLVGSTSAMDFLARGVVQRHDPNGMAVAFTHLDPDSYLHILNLVKLHTTDEG